MLTFIAVQTQNIYPSKAFVLSKFQPVCVSVNFCDQGGRALQQTVGLPAER